MSKNIGPALTWEDLAEIYDKFHSDRPARTLPMDLVFKWVEKRKKEFHIDPTEGTLHKILK